MERLNEREISLLLKATKAVLKYQSFEQAARTIFDACRELIGAQSGYIALLSPEKSNNEVLFLESGGLPCNVDENLPMPIRGLRAEAYRTGKPVYDNNFMKSEWVKFMPKGHVILNNVLFAPLNIDNETIGIMGLANKDKDITENDIKIASAFSELAAISLSNSRMLDSLIKSERECQVAYSQTELYKDIFMHDINNILQNLTSSAELINKFIERPEEIEKIRTLLSLIKEQTQRGSTLVKNVQNISSVLDSKERLTNIDALDVLNKAVRYIHKSYSELNTDIQIETEFKEVIVRANELLLDVFENILLNAIKHNEENKKEILVRISKEVKDKNSYIKIEFIDNGQGVSDQMKQMLFKERIEKKIYTKGMGIGLITVKKILSMYNADISVEDKVQGDFSKGSNFIIVLKEVI